MTRTFEARILKLEQYRLPRPPYVIRVGSPRTGADNTAVASARGYFAIIPHKCASVDQWRAHYAPKELQQ